MKLITHIIILFLVTLLGTSCQDTIPARQTVAKNASTSPDTDEPDTTITRPTGAVFFKSDYCGCKDGKVVTLGDCASYCATLGSTSGAERFTANFNVGTDISLNASLVNVKGWCEKLLPGESTNPSCVLEAKDDGDRIVNLPVTVTGAGNSISATLENLSYDKTYLVTLVETTSGARSDTIQIVKYSADTSLSTLGPLKNVPVTQYACVVRKYSTVDETSDLYYDSAYRIHFYFIPRLPPSPIPAGNSYLICHDIVQHGLLDDILFPRFEQTPAVFNFWDTTDPRFYDNNQNNYLDVNDLIVQKTKNFGGTIPASTNFFFPMALQGGPALNVEAGNTATNLPLGYYMAPWIDQTTYKSYCLNNSHYNSTNPLFKALRDVIGGVETEALYIGEKPAETVRLSDGTYTTGEKDYILIRESQLKQVWFYLKNGVPTVPTDSVIQNNAVYFYYPLDFSTPFVPKSHQRTFQVKNATQLNNGTTKTGATDSGTSSSVVPHDNRIGCIPKF